MARSNPLPSGPFHDCVFCADSGIHDIEGEWKFCRCAAGVAKRVSEPGAVEEANRAKEKLDQIGAK